MSKLQKDWEEWDDFVAMFEAQEEEGEKQTPVTDLLKEEKEAMGAGYLSVSAIEGVEAE